MSNEGREAEQRPRPISQTASSRGSLAAAASPLALPTSLVNSVPLQPTRRSLPPLPTAPYRQLSAPPPPLVNNRGSSVRPLPFTPPPPIHPTLLRAHSEILPLRPSAPLSRSATYAFGTSSSSSTPPDSARTTWQQLDRRTSYIRYPPRLPRDLVPSALPPPSQPLATTPRTTQPPSSSSDAMSSRRFPSPHPPLPPSPSTPPASGPYPPISTSQHQQWSMPTPQPYHPSDPPPHAPPFVSHNSEGTNERRSSASGSNGVLSGFMSNLHLRPTQSTSALVPSPPPVSEGRRSSRPPSSGGVNGVGSGSSHGGGGQGWEGPARGQGWSGPHAVEKRETGTKEAEMEAAMRASMAEAELSRAQKASARAEEERQIALMMSYSAEQDHIRAMRIAEEREAEERALRQVLLQSRRDKGKGRQQETDEERRQLELVMQLSLEEAARRRGSGQTSAEVFERLSRSGFVVEENQSEGRRRTPPRIQSSTSSARVSHSLFNNPSSPSVSSPGPISSRPTPSTQPDIHPDIANPPPAYEYPVAPEPSPGLEEEYSRTVILGPGRPLSQDPNLPTASTSAQRAASPPLPPLPSSSPSRPSLSTRTSSYASQSSAPGASAFYSTAVAAATSSHPRLRPPFSTTTTTESVSGSTILVNSPSPVSAAVEAEDPFDEQFAAVDPLPGDFAEEGGAANGDERAGKDLWELTHGSRRSPASVVSTDGAASTTEPFNERLLTPSTTMFDPNRSSTSLSPSTTSFEDRRSSPLWGGLVDTSSANAIADETVLSGVKFGFVPVARRAQHPPLEHQGAFPDVAQLSRMGGSEGDSQEYTSFAVEASSWKTLLTYLMWHGNSHIEAAPRDLQGEKSGRGLQCAILVEFFRSFEDHSTKVRCRLDLLPPLHSYDPYSDGSTLSTSFDPGCPSITIRLPQPPFLPISLATLATTLSAAHTLSRQTKSAWHSSSSTRALQDLANAVDLFKTLNGEVVTEDAGEVEDQESGLLRRLKGRLRRRKKAPGIVKGGADGTGEGRPLEGNDRPLPEGAGMITPFLLAPQ